MCLWWSAAVIRSAYLRDLWLCVEGIGTKSHWTQGDSFSFFSHFLLMAALHPLDP